MVKLILLFTIIYVFIISLVHVIFPPQKFLQSLSSLVILIVAECDSYFPVMCPKINSV